MMGHDVISRTNGSEALSEASEQAPVYSCRHIYKFFGALRALSDVSLDIYAGQVLALLGDNGAGKSTLSRIISGFDRPDSGEIWIDGARVRRLSAQSAHKYGIEAVPQDLALCDNLSAAMNVVLGRPPLTWWHVGNFGFVDRRAAANLASEHVSEVGTRLPDYMTPIRRLSGGQRQAIAIGRALMRRGRLVIFDEPTAALGVRQRRSTMHIIRETADRGVAVLVISHNVEEILEIADRVVCLRLGCIVMDTSASAAKLHDVHLAMEGENPAQG
jgi:ABC-type sugar transport system ATPase subunit